MPIPILDHVFLFVDEAEVRPGGKARGVLDALGLLPSYAREHPGQGTANLCWCFDDAYLELLFVTDQAELDRPDDGRNGFRRRAAHGVTGACPFGIAVRGGPPPGPVRPYRFDALPPGLTLPVSLDSDDPAEPFVFGSPGTAAPAEWTDGRAGARQTAAGFLRLSVEDLVTTVPSALSGALAAAGVIGSTRTGSAPEMTLRMEWTAGGAVRLRLPAFEVI